MAKYTFAKFKDNVSSVVKVAANTATLPTHTLVTIDPGTFAVTVKATAAAAGDFLIYRPYPNYGIVGDRMGKIAQTPIATGVGEVYGFKLKAGDSLIVEDNTTSGTPISGLVNGALLQL